jgi:hypothetical protein
MTDPNDQSTPPTINHLLPPDQSIMVHLADGRVEYLLIKAPIALLDLLQEVADDKQTAVTGFRLGVRINQPTAAHQPLQPDAVPASPHPAQPRLSALTRPNN